MLHTLLSWWSGAASAPVEVAEPEVKAREGRPDRKKRSRARAASHGDSFQRQTATPGGSSRGNGPPAKPAASAAVVTPPEPSRSARTQSAPPALGGLKPSVAELSDEELSQFQPVVKRSRRGSP